MNLMELKKKKIKKWISALERIFTLSSSPPEILTVNDYIKKEGKRVLL